MDLLTPAPSSYQTYFRENCLRSPGTSALDDDAALALHLITFLINNHRQEGYWSDRDMRKAMRNTCHALEALHLLDLPAYTQDFLIAGVTWLINLSSGQSPDDDEEEFESQRLHPSRFKTLAWLSSFDTSVVSEDFERLTQNVDRDGFLRNVDRRHLLATLIFLDTLLDLTRTQTLPAPWQRHKEGALDAVHREVINWHENPSTFKPLVSAQELSYALDILVTSGVLSPQDVVTEAIRRNLVAELDTNDESILLDKDALYCSIQLCRHFGSHRDTQRILGHLRGALLRGYQTGAVAGQEFPFHPLVLRLLTTCHDTRLRDAIVKHLFRTYQEQSRSEQQARQSQVKTELRQLLQKYQVQVEITDIQELGGGMKAEKVYAVEFDVALSGPDEQQPATLLSSDSQKLVVKTAPFEDLRRSIDQYISLPASIRPLFATQSHDPYMIDTARGAVGYLIMQDLMHMQTLDAVLDELDVPVLAPRQVQSLTSAVSRVAAALHRVHQEEVTSRDNYAGDQIARLYLARLEDSIIRLGQKFPRLKPEMRGFYYNDREFKALNYYLSILQSRTSRLNPTGLCLVHGDCHTRNIMLDRSNGRVMFIDLDRIDHSGDYIDDFALLLEDACVYRYLSDGEGGGVLRPSDVLQTSQPDGAIGWRCARPLFQRPLTQRFQAVLLDLLPGYAQAMHGDDNWRPRLWLATTVRLLGLATLVDEENFALVLYAEAVRLIATLCTGLTKNEPLPQLLFGPSGPAATDTTQKQRETSLVQLLQDAFPTLSIRPSGSRYEFRQADGPPVAILMTVDRTWRLVLAAAPESLRLVAPDVKPYQSGSLRARVELPPDPDKAFDLAGACLRAILD